jgi:hypothetical protein
MPEPQPAASRPRRSSRPRTAPARDGTDYQRLPAAPLLQAVQQRARRRQSLRELLGPELFGAYGNAHASGSISLVTLERFCDEALDWHPACSTARPTTTQLLSPSHERHRTGGSQDLILIS